MPVAKRAFLILYGTSLAHVLVIVAYLLPWDQRDALGEGLLESIYSQLTHEPSGSVVFFLSALIASFMTAIASLLLTLVACAGKSKAGPALRTSSMLSSVALVGPLLYIHKSLPAAGSGLPELSNAIDEAGVGWFIALLCGSAASLLSLYMHVTAEERGEWGCPSKKNGLGRAHTIHLFIVPASIIMTVSGFFLPWSSGSVVSLWGRTSWSVDGFEVSSLMYLVPAAALLSSAFSIGESAVTMKKRRILSQTGQNLVALTFALALSWGLAFGGAERPIPGMFFSADLQFGWYLCTIGLLMLLLYALLGDTLGSERVRDLLAGKRTRVVDSGGPGGI